ncbi:Ig-like domain-containing protein [Chitiniphilus purpureus]|uniref:Ig-like domain-containing protein n=1 Tax=Chitiniphilus purpureus TaxID=2981137 RepID=A0ABY6DJM2_9NEIS|nr:Ig-like domain-containing protein [Chitiniphilus sp. CD1]UXY14237.1 Ig-like domain-containing protein [Chitiniphilus sp. CD1]
MSNAPAQATIVHILGDAYRRDADGKLVPLKQGDRVEQDQIVVTAPQSGLVLALPGGEQITLGEDRTVLVDASVLGTEPADPVQSALAQVEAQTEQLAQVLEQGGDLSEVLEPAAAGLTGGGDNSGHSFVRLMRMVEQLRPGTFGFAGLSAEEDTPLVTETAPTAGADAATVDVPLPGNETPSVPATPPVDVGPPAAPNQVPLVAAVSHVLQEDSSVSGRVSASDADNDALLYSLKAGGGPEHGTVSLTADGSYVYTPAGDYNGADRFTVLVADGRGGITEAVVSLLVTPVNDAPSGNDLAITTREDTAVSGAVSASDRDGDGLSYVKGSEPAHGTVTVDAGGNYIYVPAPDYNGDDAFTVIVSDGQGGVESITVNVRIEPVADAGRIDPATPGADRGEVVEDSVLAAQGRLVIRDPDATPATFVPQSGTAGSYGRFTLDGDGTWRYQLDNANPAVQALTAGETRTETFSVTNTDGVSSAVVVTIRGTDDAAVISGTATGQVTEDLVLSTSGQLRVTDADAGQAAFRPGTVVDGDYGTLRITADGSWQYTLNNNAALVQGLKAGETVTRTVNVASVDGTSHAIVITVGGTNEAAGPGGGTVQEDVTLSATGVLTATGGIGFVAETLAGRYGTLQIAADGNWQYTLSNGDAAVQELVSGQRETERFTVQLADGSTTEIVVQVQGLDDGAVITPATPGGDRGSVTEDGTLLASGRLVVSDADAGQAVFQPRTVVDGDYGTLQIAADGSWQYTLNNSAAVVQGLKAGEMVTRAVNVTSADGTVHTIVVDVLGTNDGPLLANDAVTTDEDQPLTLSPAALLGNDQDVDGNLLTLVSVQDATQGTVALVNGNVVFTPAANYNGPASFTYTVSDGQGGTSTATVNVQVNAVNDAPVNTVPAAQSVAEDTALVFSSANGNAIRIGDVDAGSRSMTVTLTATHGVLHLGSNSGGVTLSGNGSDTVTLTGSVSAINAVLEGTRFVPTANYDGGAQLTVTTSDNGNTGAGGAKSDVDTIAITVTAVNDAPVLNDSNGNPLGNDLTVTTNEDTPVNGQLTATDVDGDPLSFTKGTDPVHGTVTVNPNGSWTYTPNANYNGSDSFTVTVSDSKGGTDTVTVNVGITPVADPAVIGGDDQGAVTEDLGVTAAGKLSDTGTLTVSDPDAGQSSFTAGAATPVGATLGGLTIDTAGHWTYQVDNVAVQYLKAGETRTEQFTVQSADGTSHVISVVISGTNDGPVAGVDVASTAINTPISNLNVLANDTDVDGNPLTVTGASVVDPSKGTVTLNPDGTLNFVPAGNVTGPVSISYQIDDGAGGSATGTLTVNVGANTPPTGADQTVTLQEDGSHGFSAADFGFSDSDVGQTLQAVRIDSLPGAGSLTLNGVPVSAHQVINVADLGNLVFTPAANANGVGYASFTFSVQDSAGGFDAVPNTVSFNVTPVNDAPVPQAVTASGNEDTMIAVNLTGTDVDGTVASFKLTSLPANGTFYSDAAATNPLTLASVITATSNGATIYFKPNADWNGSNTFQYSATDNNGLVSTGNATGTLTVNAVNDAPVAAADVATTNEDQPLTLTAAALLANDQDADGNPLTLVSVQDATQGTVALVNGNVVFTPAANYNGPASFTYTVSDGQGGTSTATVNVQVNAVNDAPVNTVPAAQSVAEDTALVFSSANGNAIRIGDVDAGSRSMTVTLTATHGVLHLGSNSGGVTLSGNGSDAVTLTGSVSAINAVLEGTRFVPTANYDGGAQLTVTTSDNGNTGAGGAKSDVDTIAITVTAVNDAPVAAADVATTNEDQPLTLTAAALLANDQDADGNSLTLVSVQDATQGTVALVNGNVVFTPAANYNGPASFTYTVSDGQGGTSTATVNVQVNAVNDAPVPQAVTASGNEDTVIAVNLTGTDVDGTVASFKLTSLPANGTFYSDAAATNPLTLASVITATSNGATIYFKPNADWNGSNTFQYSATDNNGLVSTGIATGTLTVNPVNDAPVLSDSNGNPLGNDLTVTTNEDTPVNGQLTATDVDGDPLSFTKGTDPVHGTVTVNPNGSWTYTPNANYNGSDSFTVTVSDSKGGTDTVTVNVGITPVADPAVIGGDDQGAVTEDLGVTAAGKLSDTGTLTVSDPDAGQSSFTAGAATPVGATLGGLTIDAAGHWTYQVDNVAVQYLKAGETRTEQFTVQSADGTSHVISVVISGTNDGPVAGVDVASTAINTPISNLNVLANDTDVDGNPLTVTGASVVDPSKGTVTLNPDGTLNFVPAGNVTGPVSISYQIDDGAGGSATGTLTVNVGANTPPTGADQTVTLQEDGSHGFSAGDFGFSDSDVGQTLQAVRIDSLPGAGSLTLNGVLVSAHQVINVADLGNLVFTPAANANGVGYASFTFSVQDSAGGFDAVPNTVSFNVTPVNDAPVAQAVTASGNEDTVIAVNLAGTDVDGTVASFKLTSLPANGTFYSDAAAANPLTLASVITATSNGATIYFKPNADWNGSNTFQYSATDNNGLVSTGNATGTLTVNPVNDAPIAAPDSNTTAEDTTLAVSAANGLLANDSDVDGNPLTITQFSIANVAGSFTAGQTATIAGVGSLTINGNGSYSFVPVANYNGPVPVATYTVSDGTTTTTSTLTLNVTAVADPTVTAPDTLTVAEDTVASGNVLVNDSDVDTVLTVAGFSVNGVAGSFTAGQTATLAGVGSFTLGSNGDYSFTPVANWNGNVPQVSYTTNTGVSSTLNITVTAVNDAPVLNDSNGNPLGNDLTVTTNEDTPVNGQLTATDVDGDPLSFTKGTDPVHGTVTVNPNGSWTYTPNANYNGSDSFTVTVSDSKGGTDTVTVNVGITPVADPAVIGGDDQGAVTEDLGVTAAGKLSDTGTLTVSDPDAGQSSFTAGAATPVGATLGGLTIDTAGHWTYQVDNVAVQYLKAGETRTEQFTVQSADGTSHVISVVISGTNDDPVAGVDVASTAINTPISNLNVLANDTDVDGNPLTVTGASVVDPSKGTVTLNPDGTLNFVPAGNVTGPVSISYQIDDGAGGSATGTLTVNVGANTPPTGADQTVTLQEDGSHGFSAADFGFSDSDVGQTLQAVRIDSLPGAGSLTLNGVPVSAHQVINVADLGNLVFTPAANANGVGYASFTFSVQDSAGVFDAVPNTVSFNVTPVNDAPVAVPESNTTAEDTPLTVSAANGLLANDSDIDGNPLTITQFSIANVAGSFTAGQTATIAGVGSLTINGNGSYSFVPVANYNGPVPVATYTVSDGITTTTSTLTLNVTAVNDAPVSQAISATGNEDTVIAVNLTGTDVDGTVASFKLTSLPANGTFYSDIAATNPLTLASVITATSNGATIYFKPNADWSGSNTFQYSATDNNGLVSTGNASGTLTVNAVNDAPVPQAVTASGNEDTVIAVNLTGTDVDGTVASFKLTSLPANGTFYSDAAATNPLTLASVITATSNGVTIYFKPNADWNGSNTFQYSATDNNGLVSTGNATGTLTVNAVNDAPVAAADVATTNEDQPLTLTAAALLANDQDADGNPLTLASVQDATQGTVALVNGNVVFTPAANYNGPASFTYTVSDGQGGTSTATVTVQVNAVNDAPVNTVPAAQSVAEDTALVFSSANGNAIRIGDVDAGSRSMTVTLTATHGVLHLGSNSGGVTLSGNGSDAVTLTGSVSAINAVLEGTRFVPTANYDGGAQLTVTTSDNGNTGAGGAKSDVDTIAITVTAVNDAPVAAADVATTNEDQPLTLTAAALLANDQDADGNSLTLVSVQDATQGTVALVNGNVVFTPAANYNGPASFTYTVSDGQGGTSTATVNVQVNAVNDAPVAQAVTASGNEDTVIAVNLTGTDVDGTVASFKLTSLPANGTFYSDAAATNPLTLASVITATSNGATIYFKPNADWNGSNTFQYSATDNNGLVSTGIATGTLTVNALNDAPVAQAVTASGNEDTVIAVNLTGTDVDGTVASFKLTSLPANGTFYSDAAATNPLTLASVITATNNGATIYFKPNADWNGSNTFQYSATDNNGLVSTGSATGTLTVNPVNDAPIAAPDSNTTAEDTTLAVSAANGLLANDSDVDGNPLTITQFSIANVAGSFTAGQTATIAGVGSLTINGNGSYSFVPVANYNGPVPVATYTVSDGTTTTTSTLTLNVTAVADPTVTAPDTLTVAEDSGTSTGNVLSNDSDADGPLSVSQFVVSGTTYTIAAGGSATATLAGVGTLVMNSNGSYSFTPATNYNGAVPVVTYTATDGSSSANNTLRISVTAVDDPSVLAPDTKTVAEDTVASGNVLVNDSDVDTVLTVAGFSVNGVAGSFTAGQTATLAGVGSFTLGSNGDYSFTPVANWNGNVPQVSYTTNTGVSSTLNITVTAVNDVPITAPDSNTTAEDTPLTVSAANGLLANDSDIDGNPLTITQFSIANVAGSFTAGQTATIAGVGSLTINGNGSYSFVPVANYNGPVPVATYTVSDGITTTTSTLTLNVTAVNDAPVSQAISATGNEDTVIAVNLTGTDVDGTVASFKLTSLPANGTFYSDIAATNPLTLASVITATSNGATIYFKPNADWSGSNTFQYSATDNNGLVSTGNATGTLTVNPVNDAPTTTGGSVTGTEDTPLVLSWSQFNAGDIDTPVSGLSVKMIGLPTDGTLQYNNGNGWVSITANQLVSKTDIDAGKLRFVPDTHESGSNAYSTAGTGDQKADYAKFTYQISDGSVTSSTATMTVDIAPTADRPTLTLNVPAAQTAFNTTWESVINSDGTSEGVNATTLEGWTLVTAPDSFSGGLNRFEVWTSGDQITNQAGSLITGVGASGGNGNWLELNNASSNSLPQTLGIERSVSTAVGQVYTLSFDYAGRSGYSTAYTQIAILVDGVKVATYSSTSPQGGLNWEELKYSFAGDGNAHTIRIITDATSFDSAGRGAMIDDIKVESSSGLVAGNTSGGKTEVTLANYVSGQLVDTDGSESLTYRFTGLPTGAVITTSGNLTGYPINNGGITLSAAELASAKLVLPSSYTSGTLNIGVSSIATEGANASTDSTSGTLTLNVMATGLSRTTVTDTGSPVAVADSYTTPEDQSLTFNPLSNDTLRDGARIAGFTQPANGSLTLNANGTLTYNPPANYSGTTTFSYTLVDGNGQSSTATVTLNVTPVNDAPVVDSHSITSREGVPTALAIAAPTDAEGDRLTVTITGLPTQGTVMTEGGTVVQNGQVISISQLQNLLYVSPANITATTSVGSLSYRVNDGTTNSNGAIAITVTDNPNVITGHDGVGTYYVDGAESGAGNTFSVASAAYNAGNGQPAGGYDLRTVTTSGNEQVIFTGGSNDHVEAGAGNDAIFMGETQSNDNSVALTTQAEMFTGTRNMFMTTAESNLLNSSDKLVQGVVNQMQPVSDLANAGSGDDVVYGQGGTDALYGGAGSDKLYGGDGGDALRGGAGHDLVVGGASNDLLRGDLGDDVFKWTLGDQSAMAGAVNAGSSNGLYLQSNTRIVAGATDLIVDFNASTTSGNNDKLDLRDLLQNESHTGTNVGNLGNYLHFETINNTAGGKSTIVHISHDGDFSGGYNNGTAEDQTIVLHGVDLGATGNNDAAVIQDLLNKGKLITD